MRIPALWFLYFILLTASGCNSVQDYSQPTVHDLGPLIQQQNNNTNVNWSVTTIDAPVWLWDDQIRYRLLYADPTQVGYYTKDRWIGPPPSLLRHKLTRHDGNKKLYRLHIQLLDFEQLFDQPGQSRVVLNVHVTARLSDNRKIVAERNFNLQQQTSSADAQGAIRGFVTISDDLIEQLNQWLLKLSTNSDNK